MLQGEHGGYREMQASKVWAHEGVVIPSPGARLSPAPWRARR